MEQDITTIKQTKYRAAQRVRCIETGQVFTSMAKASNWYQQETGGGRIVAHISDCCKGKCKTAGGYSWEYVD